MSRPKIHLVAAARPNFMKIAPLYRQLEQEGWSDVRLIHPGQHYDDEMSGTFIRDLGLPQPHFHLGVGSGSHAEQTAGVLVAYERVCQTDRPDWVVVAGDVNATIACALAAKKLLIRVAHLEAGLRSRDWSMPEEVNRVLTDAISDLLWTPSPDADENLAREGVAPDRIVRVGNIMIDSYELMRPRIDAADMPARAGVAPRSYVAVTLHRPSNVDSRPALARLVNVLRAIASRVRVVFAVHPRTMKRLQEFELLECLSRDARITLLPPVSYVDFMSLVGHSLGVVTDSGGVQEETTYLGIPCLTLRTTTERPITVLEGTNRLGTADDAEAQVARMAAGEWPAGRRPELWDGRTALRVAASLKAATA